MNDFLPVIVTALVIAGGIAGLRVFFTFWAPIDRLINPGKTGLDEKPMSQELRDKNVDVHLKSGVVLENVMLMGYCTAQGQMHHGFKQLLIVKHRDQRKGYIRIDEIEYLEE